MKLSDYARAKGVRYETAWRWFRDGKIKGRRIGKHTILIEEEEEVVSLPQKVAIYARVCSTENKSNLESQAERLTAYCTAKRLERDTGTLIRCVLFPRKVGAM